MLLTLLVSAHLQDLLYINVISSVLFLKIKHIMFAKGHLTAAVKVGGIILHDNGEHECTIYSYK